VVYPRQESHWLREAIQAMPLLALRAQWLGSPG